MQSWPGPTMMHCDVLRSVVEALFIKASNDLSLCWLFRNRNFHTLHIGEQWRTSCFVVGLFSCLSCAATAWDATSETELKMKLVGTRAFPLGRVWVNNCSDNSLVVEACLTRFQLSHCRRWKATVALMQCWLLVGAISAHQLAGNRTGRSSEPWRMLPLRRA